MKKLNYNLYILIIIAIIFLQVIYWYFVQSNTYGFLYSLKNSSHNVVSTYDGKLNFISFNEEGLKENDLRFLKSKGVNIIIGPNFSSSIAIIEKELEKYDLIALSPSITSNDLLNNKNIFSLVPINKIQVGVIVSFLKEKNIKNVLLVLDPFNKIYSKDFLDILKSFNGKAVYFYSSKLSNIVLDSFDAIVITLSPNLALDFFNIISDYSGIILLSDSAVDSSLIILPSYNNLYIVDFGFKKIDWPLITINEIISLLSKHKFISSEQFVSYFINHTVVNNQAFTPEGYLIRNIRIEKFDILRKEIAIEEGQSD
ncbi:hypothetical protein HNP65_000019 [Thermosipho japonicus]|uniref:Leucine-binding protein domain-containing protein n=1 Tax=Thermosipho japonicus TaxID=90323 RepID=A0A841GGX6_9BACT|nr:ABC transporter substrate-binding protein [Thermosipho japonicus]MBB6061597.1 hypothetical protein [Thermosipho japonicus]